LAQARTTSVDPIKERARLRREAERAAHTLADMIAETHEKKRDELKTEASWVRWDAPLRTHLIPKLGKVPIAELDASDIRDALRPIWNDKAETSRKTINRLGQVMTYAAALGLDVDLQAIDKAKALLGKQKAKARHIRRWIGARYRPFTRVSARTQPNSHSSSRSLQHLDQVRFGSCIRTKFSDITTRPSPVPRSFGSFPPRK
jgi:hypothetical protein